VVSKENYFSAQSVPLVGRSAELDKISQLLQNPACRLVTIAGVGGVGKTRLARQLAAHLAQNFPDGIYFVDLQGVTAVQYLPAAFADALKLDTDATDLPPLLKSYLQTKSVLLILDNFEHLLAGTDFLIELLEATENLKLLVTSRESLNSKWEWVYPLAGLAFPNLMPDAENSDLRLDNYPAAQLFSRLAQRFNAGFDVEKEQTHIFRLCALVEGLPLALELAASWLKLLPLEKIVTGLQRNFDMTHSNLRDIPARHRSMRTVFDTSWRMLSYEEQDALQKLAIFRAGFGIEAAQEIAGATLGVLLALVEKSLVQQKSDGRYYLHELLRQYAGEQIAADWTRERELHQKLAKYFVGWLNGWLPITSETDFHEFKEQTVRELDNLRLAWDWLVREQCLLTNPTALRSYQTLYYYHNRAAEAISSLEAAAANLERNPKPEAAAVLAQVWAYLGYFYQSGQLEKAKNYLHKSMALFEQTGAVPFASSYADPQASLAILYSVMGGRYDDAIELGQRAAESCRVRGDRVNEAIALFAQGQGYYYKADYVNSDIYLRRSYTLVEKTNDLEYLPIRATCLHLLSMRERALNNLGLASRYAYEHS
jgi:predicted ATPase